MESTLAAPQSHCVNQDSGSVDILDRDFCKFFMTDTHIRSEGITMENMTAGLNLADAALKIRPLVFDTIAHAQSQCAMYLRTLVSDISFKDNILEVRGWSLSLWTPVEQCSMLLNGINFSETIWIKDELLEDHFNRLTKSGIRRFICRQKFDDIDDIFDKGFLRISFVQDGTETQRTYRSSWYFPDTRVAGVAPNEERISRVIGRRNSLTPYLMGGASLFNRYDKYLDEQLGRPLSMFKNILDWGCGAGRLTRYLGKLHGPKVSGIDIDHDNIAWCKENISNVDFFEGPLSPPTKFPDKKFDLLFGTSVFTHLDEEQQFLWLQELARISAVGAVLLMTKIGPSNAALEGWPDTLYSDLEQKGFLFYGQNSQLDDFIADNTYYKDVAQSDNYIFTEWSKYFDIIDIVPAMAANQDVVVMRRRGK
jgi:SAM-dependent methyltransferase